MFLKSLRLQNFQKHSDLQINFVNGVNVLFGASDIGKSCIRRSIEWIVQNENMDGIRKTGTKKTSVSIILDNNIEIERIRSTSINRYIIRKDKDEQIFDSVGKSIPDEVKEALGVFPIEVDGEEIYLNSQPQIGLPFLFDKSPSFRMKLFNKLTGNDVLDKLFGEFNKDILRIKRNKREEEERFENGKTELTSKKIEMEKAEAIHKRLKIRLENIKKLNEKYSKLLRLKELHCSNITSQDLVKKSLSVIKFPQINILQQLREKIDRFTILLTHKNRVEEGETALNEVRGQLKDSKPLSIDLGNLRAKIDRFHRIDAIFVKNSQNQDSFSKIRKNSRIIDMDLKSAVNNYKRLLKEIKICPICQSKLTEDHLEEIRL